VIKGSVNQYIAPLSSYKNSRIWTIVFKIRVSIVQIVMSKVISCVLFILLVIAPFTLSYSNEIEKIKQIYEKQCGTCHGNKGDGRGRAGVSLSPAPTDFTATKNKSKLTLPHIKSAIANGVAGTTMVSYQRRFNNKQIDALASYIRDRFVLKQEAKPQKNGNDEGRAIYVKNCSACHGDNGNTAVWAKNGLNPAPRDFTSALAMEELTRERMLTSVTYGRPGTAMMPFEKRLSAEQINLVITYIRAQFMEKVEAPSDTPNSPPQHLEAISKINMSLEFPDGLFGNAKKGETFFQNNCFTCHGKNGNGKGPRSHFNFPKPRDFTSKESRQIYNRPRLFKAISHGKTGSVMPAWSTVLSRQQIADVAEYVFQTFILGLSEKKKS